MRRQRVAPVAFPPGGGPVAGGAQCVRGGRQLPGRARMGRQLQPSRDRRACSFVTGLRAESLCSCGGCDPVQRAVVCVTAVCGEAPAVEWQHGRAVQAHVVPDLTQRQCLCRRSLIRAVGAGGPARSCPAVPPAESDAICCCVRGLWSRVIPPFRAAVCEYQQRCKRAALAWVVSGVHITARPLLSLAGCAVCELCRL